MITHEEIKRAVVIVLALGEAIHDLGCVPSGQLYARVAGHLTLDAYESALRQLVDAGAVRRDGDELVWIEPAGTKGGQ